MVIDQNNLDKVLIGPDLWFVADHIRACNEGWCIYMDGPSTEIIRVKTLDPSTVVL